jgi:hypothetical protein
MSRAEDLVVLARVLDELSALLSVGDLESQGVPAVVVGGLTAQLRVEAPGLVSVMVRRMDLPRAQALLEQNQPPEGWEDEAEGMPREGEEGDPLEGGGGSGEGSEEGSGDDADGREARRGRDL